MWKAYLRYLKYWANTHKEEEYQGMTPASYEEFAINEASHSLEQFEAMKSWIWEHCSTDTDYILALHYTKFTEEEMYAELQEELGYNAHDAEEIMVEARKHF